MNITNFETTITRLETKIDDLSRTVNRLLKRQYRKRNHLPKASGVYEIINTVTGEKYVGSAKNICTRISSHFSRLRQGNSECRLLQESFNEYGEEVFTSHALQLVNGKEERLDLEQTYLDREGEYTLNTLRNSRSRIGVKSSSETREKMAFGKTGELHPKFKGYYTTPWGTFTSPYAAFLACPDREVSHTSITIYCEKSDTVINQRMYGRSRYLQNHHDRDVIGMTCREIGFGFAAADYSN